MRWLASAIGSNALDAKFWNMTAPPIIATTITARRATNIQFLDMGNPFWFTYVVKYIRL
jgi:hypothetical protein